jgi:hypothetical protein
MITGHTFTGGTPRSSSHSTLKNKPLALAASRPKTVEHVLLHCPLFADSRRSHLTTNGRLRSLPQLFTNPERVLDVLHFLEFGTDACLPQTADSLRARLGKQLHKSSNLAHRLIRQPLCPSAHGQLLAGWIS